MQPEHFKGVAELRPLHPSSHGFLFFLHGKSLQVRECMSMFVHLTGVIIGYVGWPQGQSTAAIPCHPLAYPLNKMCVGLLFSLSCFLSLMRLKCSQSLTIYEESVAKTVIIIIPKQPYSWSQPNRCRKPCRLYFSSVFVV